MDETAKGGDDDRDVHGPMLGARIGDLMCCVVVMQVEDRSHSELKGNDVYDRIYRLKANVTERIYNKSDLLCIDCNGIADPSPTWDASSAKEESAYVWKRVREVQKHESREEKVSERRFERAKGRARTDPIYGGKPHTRTRAHSPPPSSPPTARASAHPHPKPSCAPDCVCGILRGRRVRSGAISHHRTTPPQDRRRRRARSRTAATRSHRRSRSIKGPAAVEEGEADGEGECKGGGDKDEFTYALLSAVIHMEGRHALVFGGAISARRERGRRRAPFTSAPSHAHAHAYRNRRVPVHCSKPKPPFLRMAESAPEEGDGEASGGRGGGRGGYGAGFGVGLRYVENGPMPDPGSFTLARFHLPNKCLPITTSCLPCGPKQPRPWNDRSVCPAAGQESAETCGDDGAMKERESLRRGHMYVLAGRREAGAGRSGRGRRGGLG
ncbi:hypothetical protein B0H13DRAFT_1923074 [Mycena leptocephala]|nr:hypothetical protein B0H13DRAFT_1923074 [Mycena leptocephala]